MKKDRYYSVIVTQFSSVQLLSRVQLFVNPWTAACQASLSLVISWSWLKLIFIDIEGLRYKKENCDDTKSWLIGKDSDAGRDWGQEEKGTTEDEMAGWHHRLDGRESGWTPGVVAGQGGLECCDSWGRKQSVMTERLNWTELKKPMSTTAIFFTFWCKSSSYLLYSSWRGEKLLFPPF